MNSSHSFFFFLNESNNKYNGERIQTFVSARHQKNKIKNTGCAGCTNIDMGQSLRGQEPPELFPIARGLTNGTTAISPTPCALLFGLL